ncbi:MAG TPA: hypothetical protein VGK30_05715 [Candidatus Binatia bacterium]|jgi:hypothetical protein
MNELSRYCFLAGALPALFLGIAHLVVTPLALDRPKGLSPRDPALAEAMARTSILLTRRVDMWRAWIGFNLSHGVGVTLFAVVVLLVGRSDASFAAQADVFVPLAVLVSGTYVALGLRYWFRSPVLGCSLSFVLFLCSLGLRA